MVNAQWYITVREKNSGLAQLLAIEQSVSAPVLCSRQILIADGINNRLHAFFSGDVRSLEWYAVQRQVPSISRIHEIVPVKLATRGLGLGWSAGRLSSKFF
jgi:hypothetical protein